MSDIRKRLYEIFDMDISGKNKADYMFREFHISEKLTDEEMKKTKEYLHYLTHEWLGHGVEAKAEYIENILNKLTGGNNE